MTIKTLCIIESCSTTWNSSRIRSILAISKWLFLDQQKIQINLVLYRLKQFTLYLEVFKVHKLFKVICTLQFSVQTLLIHVMTQAHSHWCLTEQNYPCTPWNFVCTFNQKTVLLKNSFWILIISYSKHASWLDSTGILEWLAGKHFY